MEKFNNSTIFTGYLKQLLHNFNLPKYRIYTHAFQKYFDEHGEESKEVFQTLTVGKDPETIMYVPYIKDNLIQEYIDGKWVEVGMRDPQNRHMHNYYEGFKSLNYTKNLKIRNNNYDSYTHEYLGDYLRFIRDYYNLDLMPLYNCFSNNPCGNLKLSFSIRTSSTTKDVEFNTADTNYKIYMVPVKLFKQYTIAIDSALPIEMCCGIYGIYQDSRATFLELPALTYQKVRSMNFSSPILYTRVVDLIERFPERSRNELAQNEDKLKLFIKVPVQNTSTITILEGDYRDWNNVSASCGIATFSDGSEAALHNYTVINFENLPKEPELQLKTPLQLLAFNTGEQHPFSDRLIEYLTGNAITSIDEINANIVRAQKVIKAASNLTENGLDTKGRLIYTYRYEPVTDGFWDEHMRYALYEYMTQSQYPKKDKLTAVDRHFINKYDILGYVDKDTEKYYGYDDKENNTSVSISSVTLNEEGE